MLKLTRKTIAKERRRRRTARVVVRSHLNAAAAAAVGATIAIRRRGRAMSSTVGDVRCNGKCEIGLCKTRKTMALA